MIRSTFIDFFKQFIPSKKVETKEIEPTGTVLTPEVEEYDEPEDVDEDAEIAADDAQEKPKSVENWIYVDLTKTPRKKGSRGTSKGTRKWSQIDTICFHQTACIFSTPERMLGVPAHSGVMRDGKIVLLHNPTSYMWHGHSANKFSIGIEIVARAAGIEGDGRTFWRSSSDKKKGKKYEDLVRECTDIQLAACRELCKYYIELVKKNGGEIKYVIPHRSSHSSRVSDPGSRIWKEVALKIQEEFGLKLRKPVGSGNPVPQAWDPSQVGVRYSPNVKGF